MSGAAQAARVAWKVFLPVLTAGAGVAVAQWLVATKPEVTEEPMRAEVPSVTAAQVTRRPVRFAIRSQGTVIPRTEVTLAARVAGRIQSVADCFQAGGFFDRGQVLVEIERRDYAVRVRRLEASLKATRAQLAEAEQYLDRLRDLRAIDPAATTEVEWDRAKAAYDVAEARLAELEVQLEEAQNALADTVVVAPFDGCIRQKHADVGQLVTLGTPLATSFATDAVEVRLPVEDEQLAFLDLTLGDSLPEGTGPAVTLESEFAGRRCRWRGRIVRSEPFVDPRSRMVYLVARVGDPYRVRAEWGGQPLAVGTFVEAEIRSQPVHGAVALPESCVEPDGRLFVIDADGRLHGRVVEVVRREREWVVVRGDLEQGQYVCATPLEHAVEGMQVQIAPEIGPVATPSGEVDLTAGTALAARKPGEAELKE